LLLQRSGNVFTFFRKINAGDSWEPLPNLTITRDDLAGLPVQVGLFQAIYTANTGEVVFDSFMLDAAGLSTGTLPTPPSGLNFSSVAATTMNINWTPGAGSTGSVVVVRAGIPVNAQPIAGTTYTGNAAFGAGSQLGGGNYVVYVGTGNTVTVTGLTPGTKYYVAVYSYGRQWRGGQCHSRCSAIHHADGAGQTAARRCGSGRGGGKLQRRIQCPCEFRIEL
jgi:hypothetical protein